jgi:hypothetical protein
MTVILMGDVAARSFLKSEVQIEETPNVSF